MSVNEKIRKIREAKDWSQEQMAEKLNMSLNGYAKNWGAVKVKST